jgi:Protein of unknown function (DUF3012)
MKFAKILLILLLGTAGISCAKVGSDEWCENMGEKPKGDWTANEAGDYAKYCVLGIDPEEE